MRGAQIEFPAWPQGPLVADVRPCLEAIISVRLGDDPGRACAFWERLVADVLLHTFRVTDNLARSGPPSSIEAARTSVRRAIEVACRGPDHRSRVDWATLDCSDSDPDALANWSATFAIGRATDIAAPRGFSLRITTPHTHPWEDLLSLARELACGWPGLWRWITVGPRFNALDPSSSLHDLSRRQIFTRSRRFLLVDIGEPLGLYTSFWQNRLRTVAWCTLIASRLAPLDDEPAHPLLHATPLEGGRMLRAGERPILGDVNRDDDISAYRAMNRRLRSVRTDSGVNFLAPWDAESSAAWLSRLDPTPHARTDE